MHRYTMAAILVLLLIPTAGGASVIHVPGDYPYIQSAIDVAVAGDTVMVADGTYTFYGNIDLDLLGKAITVRSLNGPENCIIDCEGLSPGFTITSGEGRDSVVRGFTIRNGDDGGEGGGGLHIVDSSPTIVDCLVTQNSSSWRGGGIFLDTSNALISRCTISGNSVQSSTFGAAALGGGIYCRYDASDIDGCTVTGNTVSGEHTGNSGGGLYLYSSETAVTNCLISANDADGDSGGNHGGGLYCAFGVPTISHCEISGNTAHDTGGGVELSNIDTVVFTHNVISGNTANEEGGGIFLFGGAPAEISNNLICGNHSHGIGGGVCSGAFSDPLLRGNTISGNSAVVGGGGLSCSYESAATVVDTILSGNTSPLGSEIHIGESSHPSTLDISHSLVQGGLAGVFAEYGCTLNWGAGMIDGDPLFVTGPLGDYYLGRVVTGHGADSPCLDAGSVPAASICFPIAFQSPPPNMVTVCLDELTTRTDWVGDEGQADIGYHYARGAVDTVAVGLTATPASGTVPFSVNFRVTLASTLVDGPRRLAGRLDAAVAAGQNYNNWKAGWLNLGPGESRDVSWNQTIPALSSVVGLNRFTLTGVDVTPPPYNQPPFAPSGSSGTAGCIVLGVAP